MRNRAHHVADFKVARALREGAESFFRLQETNLVSLPRPKHPSTSHLGLSPDHPAVKASEHAASLSIQADAHKAHHLDAASAHENAASAHLDAARDPKTEHDNKEHHKKLARRHDKWTLYHQREHRIKHGEWL